MCIDQGPQRCDAGEARARGPSVSSQALYHWAAPLTQRVVIQLLWEVTDSFESLPIFLVMWGMAEGEQSPLNWLFLLVVSMFLG